MVGEIRDCATAEIAMKALQTGQMLLTTTHSNDSFAAITRLVDMKISSSLIASSVTAIMSRRMVRKLCACRQQVAVRPDTACQSLALNSWRFLPRRAKRFEKVSMTRKERQDRRVGRQRQGHGAFRIFICLCMSTLSPRQLRKRVEARVGFEPTDGGFADLSLRPLGYRAEVNEYSEIPVHLSALAPERREIWSVE